MPSEQFSQAVRGSGAQPIGVAQTGSIETNDYDYGAAFDSTSYPVEINPSEVIHEVTISQSADIIMEIETVTGTTIPFPLAGATGAFDRWNIDKITFKDPKGTGARIAGGWAGE